MSKPRSTVLPPAFDVVTQPIRLFLKLEAASGILLLAAAALALVWANSPWFESYFALRTTPFVVGAGTTSARFDALHLVNDGLMAIFFFVVGMEIKRELARGELRTPKRAMLPLLAAVGGMLVPAGIYLAFNFSGPGRAGWGIPMATDIAFCVGCMSLLKRRIPHALVIFLTALAIFDDIGGILVIAFFYGDGVHAMWLLAAAGVCGVAFLCNRLYVTNGVAWLTVGSALWWTLHNGGIHAAIAGVVLGLMIPARAKRSPREVLDALHAHTTRLVGQPLDAELGAAEMLSIEERLEDLEAPLDRYIDGLHVWVAFLVMPLFALANSGVNLSGMTIADFMSGPCIGVALGLFIGKQAGIFTATIAGAKALGTEMPGGATKPKVYGIALLAGIGFTVALFIATLAFPDDPRLLDQAKLGILAGSLASGVIGCVVLRLTRVTSSSSP